MKRRKNILRFKVKHVNKTGTLINFSVSCDECPVNDVKVRNYLGHNAAIGRRFKILYRGSAKYVHQNSSLPHYDDDVYSKSFAIEYRGMSRLVA